MLLIDVFDLLLATGLRIGELLGLRWAEDIHLHGPLESYITVNGAIKERGGPKRWEPFPKTEAGRREVILPPFAVEIIERRRSENLSGSNFLFHTWPTDAPGKQRPNGQQDVQRALRQVREWAGLPEELIPHALRKTVGTEVALTMGLDAAAGVLGHTYSRVTEQFYAKRTLRAPDAAMVLQAQYEMVTGRITDAPG